MLQLYLRLRNEDGPFETDPVILGTRKTERICNEIISSGFFQLIGLNPTDTNSEDSRHESYNFTEGENPYELIEFNVLDWTESYDLKEHVFTCAPLKSFFILDRPVIFYYVSKEYNVSSVEELQKPGRFVFATDVQTSSNYVILAEEAANAYTTSGYNVELHYLQMRKYTSPAKNEDDDPLCKLISVIADDPRDQYSRLCVAISKSSYFESEFVYPDLFTEPCFTEKVSFKTEEGMKEAAGMLYREQILLCSTSDDENGDGEEQLLISRAYLTNMQCLSIVEILQTGIYI